MNQPIPVVGLRRHMFTWTIKVKNINTDESALIPVFIGLIATDCIAIQTQIRFQIACGHIDIKQRISCVYTSNIRAISIVFALICYEDMPNNLTINELFQCFAEAEALMCQRTLNILHLAILGHPDYDPDVHKFDSYFYFNMQNEQ